MSMWEWGAFISFSLAILAELGGKMFFALAEHRRKLEQAREEGRKEAQEVRRETNEILMILNAAARTNPDLLPSLL